ncbi:hypothetical protein NQ317_019012 [Molorchus minor]|uniref:RNA helicase n=1 Tax=Molorchus minor TaxID=1323400 RepID=A0ABQ9J4D1_9CUCU|nr:hypothetical protein NQ317_019012 [Molorchus minor]
MKNIKIKDTHEPLEVGEVVAIRYGENYHRAIIEDLKNEEEGRALFYICWLIDIGTMFETETVYRLPPYARKPKPLALQASLNNVVYVQQHLIFDEESGQPKKIVEYVTMPTILAHRVSLEILQDVKDLKFGIEDKADGILFGDVLYQKDNEEKSLKQSLIDEGILSINENLFKDIQENIYTYKETHLLLIVQICKKLNSNLILPENNGNKAACRKMISKYLEEFDNSDLLEDHENLQPILNRRRKANHSKSPNSRNSFYSENECASESDASKSREDTTNSNVSNNVSVAKSRTKLMLEKLKRHRKTMEIEELENKGHDALNLSYSISPKQKLAEKDKEDISISVESSSDAGTSLEKTHLQNGVSKAAMETPVPEPKRKLLPKNAIIVPAGASYSIRPMASSTPKPTNSRRINGRTSSDDSDRRSKRPFKSMNVLSEDRLPSEEEKFSISEDKSLEEVAPVEQPPRTGLLNIKPVCSCKQCEHWTQESEWDKKISYGEKVPEIHSVVDVESLMLFKEGIVESERCIKSLDYKNMTKVQKQAMLKVVVHGEYSPVPVKSVTHMGFNEGIHASLRHLDYRETKRIQMYSWPAMFRNQHVCLINGPQTGKTIGYLPIMLSFLLDKEDRYKPLLKLNGPIFIILCASSKKCEDVYDLSKILLGRNKAKLFLLTYPNSQVNTANIEFLVTTPSILVDLLQSNTISFRRLCHLVIEDGDKIFAYETDIAKIFASIQNMLEHRLCHKPVQLVICADHWNSHIENILKMLNNTPLFVLVTILKLLCTVKCSSL